jgi:hypothetical protein
VSLQRHIVLMKSTIVQIAMLLPTDIELFRMSRSGCRKAGQSDLNMG